MVRVTLSTRTLTSRMPDLAFLLVGLREWVKVRTASCGVFLAFVPKDLCSDVNVKTDSYSHTHPLCFLQQRVDYSGSRERLLCYRGEQGFELGIGRGKG